VIHAGAGSDNVNPGLGVENLDGGEGDFDILTIVRDTTSLGVSFFLNGSAGNDGTVAQNFETLTYTAGSGNDTVRGWLNADNITGNAGNDVLEGGAGNDFMSGGDGNDTLRGGTGLDLLFGGAGNDRIETGGGGDNAVYGEAGDDLMIGTDDAEWLIGGIGNDTLNGSGGIDNLFGNDGNDLIRGGLGNDNLAGGAGRDAFFFDTALGAGSNVDRISDFSVADDTLRLENAIFTAVGAPGVLAAAAFKVGVAADEADDRIIYNSVSGSLFYDPDGNGTSTMINFAQLTAAPALTNADFLVI